MITLSNILLALIYVFQVWGSSSRTIRIYRESECRTLGFMPYLHYVTASILTGTVQRAPHCDMVVVHDDDLDRILRVGDSKVSKTHA
jgi:hypothetical protein